jgi:hypothetical protein
VIARDDAISRARASASVKRCCLLLSLANLLVGGAFVCWRPNNKRQKQKKANPNSGDLEE